MEVYNAKTTKEMVNVCSTVGEQRNKCHAQT